MKYATVLVGEAAQLFEEASTHGTQWLSCSEAQRLATITRAKRRSEYLACRYLLRMLASLHFFGTTQRWRDFYLEGEAGKSPVLKFLLLSKNPLYLSLAHSGCFAVAAIAENKIGVDIEKVREFSSSESVLMNEIGTSTEIDFYNQLPVNLRSHLFFKCWTRKEALSKLDQVGIDFSFLKTTHTLSNNFSDNIKLLNFFYRQNYLVSVAYEKNSVINFNYY